MTQQTTRRYGRWLALIGLAVAAALAGYGIWSRQASVTYLQQTADDAALPRVQVVLPKEGPPTEALILPGEVKAWNEAAIYGQVSGYVSQWFKDYGAHVKAGDLLATIDTPSLDAQLASSKASLAAAQTHYDLSAETAKRYDALTTLAVTQQEKDNIDATAAAATKLVSRFKAAPGYDHTGYVEYSTVLDRDRAKLSKALAAYDKVLSKLSLATSA